MAFVLYLIFKGSYQDYLKDVAVEVQLVSAEINQTHQIRELLLRSIREVCGPDYNNDKDILEAWCANFTEQQISQWIENDGVYTTVAVTKKAVTKKVKTGDQLAQAESIVGIGQILPSRARITLCHVLPEALGKGVGNLILAKLEQKAIESKLDKIELNSSITALTFYARHGYYRYDEPLLSNGVKSFPMRKILYGECK